MSSNTPTAHIMTHLVSHFPNEQISHDIALVLAQTGARYLEIQFPFSDPSADGVAIQGACATALCEPDAFSVKQGFNLISRIISSMQNKNIQRPIFVMTYANIIFVQGVQKFVKQAKQAGVSGLIVPDLPFDSDVGIELMHACKEQSLHYVPVTVISADKQRIKKMLEDSKAEYIYISLRVGITGSNTEITDEIRSFLSDSIFSQVKILAGFGIQEAQQVMHLKEYVHACVVGSVIVRSINENLETPDAIVPAVRDVLQKLIAT